MRIKHILSALLSAALCLSLLSGCAGSASQPPQSSAPDDTRLRFSTIYFDVFDTVTQIIAFCESEEEFAAQTSALYADLKVYNDLYDIYNEYEGLANLKTINDHAGQGPVAVDDRILDMLELAREMHDLTGGRMNIAMGSVLRLWHDCREAAELDPSDADNRLPDEAALQAAAQHCDITNMVIDRAAGTVSLLDPEMSLDVGSVGKGYAVEMAARAAEARGLTSASISVGGNVRNIGTKPGGVPWAIGVESPWDASTDFYDANSSYLVALNLSDLALVTSGDYQRFYTVEGTRYHHLIDPATLYPARYFNSVTILCPDSGKADCLSTALFCMPLEEGQALIESLDGIEALWCTPDGEQLPSSGFMRYEKK